MNLKLPTTLIGVLILGTLACTVAAPAVAEEAPLVDGGAESSRAAAGDAGADRTATPSVHDAEAQSDHLTALRTQLREVIEEARNQVFPALVNIQLVTSTFYGGKEVKGRSVGSGTIIDRDGHVLTNQHVTADGHRFRCTLADKLEIAATLVGEDPLTDLAVLRLDLAELASKGGKLAVARLGDSAKITVGDFVMAMGSPLALSRSVTLGIVSNTERVFAGGIGDPDSDDMRLSAGQRTGLFTRWIQHDALINPGNSGGPLVNLAGEVIGVNELGGSAIGFAIPSNLARGVADALIARGEVERSWIGISVRPIERTGFERGVLINSVVEGSPADEAGLAAGDLLLLLDSEDATVRFPEEIPVFLRRVADRPVGDKLSVVYLRGEDEHHTTIVTKKLQRDRGAEVELRRWGLTALEITPLAALERRLGSLSGALVSGVRSGGSAASAKPSLVGQDVIRRVDGQEVIDLGDLTKKYQEIMSREPLPEFVLVEFERRGESYVTLLKNGPVEDDRDPPVELPKAWLGAAVQPLLKEVARLLGVDTPTGFRVTRVYDETEAARAGLVVGDVITHVAGSRVEPRRAEDSGLLARQIQRLEIGSDVELTVVRGGAEQKVAVKLEATPIRPDEVRRDQNSDFELAVREITFYDRVDSRWGKGVAGVLVAQVESAGWAGLGGLEPGDLIQQVDGQPIGDLASFRQAMARIAKEQPTRVVMVVLRGVSTRFLYLEPEWTPVVREEEGVEPKP